MWTVRKQLPSAEDCLFSGVCPVGHTGQAVCVCAGEGGRVDSGGKTLLARS